MRLKQIIMSCFKTNKICFKCCFCTIRLNLNCDQQISLEMVGIVLSISSLANLNASLIFATPVGKTAQTRLTRHVTSGQRSYDSPC